ncbi:hypothetical protein BJY01DRAFT_245063 [Aspergillus pseudoustus]|uniref:GDSL lipase/esterase n=1 Tax=Aspergillus pseudoustus TaxID=1810923 RepID=A0ABR4KFR0_9EURO
MAPLTLLALTLLPTLALSAATQNCTPSLPPQLTNIVSFGDSYTDEDRWNYYLAHNRTWPPAGALLPESTATASGGFVWPRFIAQKTGLRSLNYAISGSTCSHEVVHRDTASFGAPPEFQLTFAAVRETQIPAFLADLHFEKELYAGGARTPENTVYTLWVGGNDFGIGGFINGQNKNGTTLTDLVHCNWDVFDDIYAVGGRRFVFFGTQALQHAPLYLPEDILPIDPESSWDHISTFGIPDYNAKMREYTTSVNTMLQYGLPFQGLSARWPGATVSFFDAHRLLVDVVEEPERYLETPVREVWEMFQGRCTDFLMTDCEYNEGPLGGYVWYDELHPSERVEEIVADELIKVLAGTSEYGATYQF